MYVIVEVKTSKTKEKIQDYVLCDLCLKKAEFIKCKEPKKGVTAIYQLVEKIEEGKHFTSIHLCKKCHNKILLKVKSRGMKDEF